MLENFTEAEKYFSPNKYNIDKENFLCTNKYLAYIYARTKKKDFEKIVDMYTNAINFNDQDIDCYLELAMLYELRKPEESLNMYEKAIELIRKIDLENYNFNATKNLYDIKEILPEILNNYSTIKIRLNNTNNVDKILKEALGIVTKRLKILLNCKNQEAIQKENNDHIQDEVNKNIFKIR